MYWFNLPFWLTKDYWKYLLAPTKCDSIWTSIKCRYKEHPCGVWYVNSYGTEPDMTCKHCGDDLG